MQYFICLLMLLSAACTSSSPEDFREEGVSISNNIVKELKKVRSRDELMDRVPSLDAHFEEMAALLARSKKYLEAFPGVEIPLFSRHDQDVSDELRHELNRLYLIEGCREILEGCQRKALNRHPELM